MKYNKLNYSTRYSSKIAKYIFNKKLKVWLTKHHKKSMYSYNIFFRRRLSSKGLNSIWYEAQHLFYNKGVITKPKPSESIMRKFLPYFKIKLYNTADLTTGTIVNTFFKSPLRITECYLYNYSMVNVINKGTIKSIKIKYNILMELILLT